MKRESMQFPTHGDNRRLVGNPSYEELVAAREKEKNIYIPENSDYVKESVTRAHERRQTQETRPLEDDEILTMSDAEFDQWVRRREFLEKDLTPRQQELVSLIEAQINSIREEYGLTPIDSLIRKLRYVHSERAELPGAMGVGGMLLPLNELVTVIDYENKNISAEDAEVEFLERTLHESMHLAGYHSLQKLESTEIINDRTGIQIGRVREERNVNQFLNEGLVQRMTIESMWRIVDKDPALKKRYEDMFLPDAPYVEHDEKIRQFINRRDRDGKRVITYESNMRMLDSVMYEMAKATDREVSDVCCLFKKAYFKDNSLLPLLRRIYKTLGKDKARALLEEEYSKSVEIGIRG